MKLRNPRHLPNRSLYARSSARSVNTRGISVGEAPAHDLCWDRTSAANGGNITRGFLPQSQIQDIGNSRSQLRNFEAGRLHGTPGPRCSGLRSRTELASLNLRYALFAHRASTRKLCMCMRCPRLTIEKVLQVQLLPEHLWRSQSLPMPLQQRTPLPLNRPA